VEEVIIQTINEYLAKRPKDDLGTRCFHPSTLHKPAEYLFKAYLEGDNGRDFEPRLLRVFDNGHSMHRRIQRYLREAGVLLETEVLIENREFEIRGHADGIVEIGGVKGILEIKSINSQGFYGLFEPKAEHLLKVNVYMFCTGLPRGVLLYENKNDQELKEFFVKQDQAVLDPVLAKIRTVQEWIKQGKVEVKSHETI
jgi:hypothetical protein